MATVPETEKIAARAGKFGPPRTLYFFRPFRLLFFYLQLQLHLIAAQSALSPAPASPAVSAGSPAPQAVPASEHQPQISPSFKPQVSNRF